MNDAALDWLATTATEAGLPWDDGWRTPLARLLDWLSRFSRKTNLIGDATPMAVAREHLIETLTVAGVLRDSGLSVTSLVDVGAGAGVETLVLALTHPTCRVVAVEPRRKRADFIELAADALAVRVSVVRRSVPEWRPDEPFVVATSRATFAPERWVDLSRALLSPGGATVVHGRAGDALCAHPGMRVPSRPEHRIHLVGHGTTGPT